MVNDVTEQNKSLTWTERKRLALEHIKDMRKESVYVKTADVLHNLTDQIEDIKKDGLDTFKRFNAPKEAQLERYQNLLKEIEKRNDDNPLLPQLRSAVEEFKRLVA